MTNMKISPPYWTRKHLASLGSIRNITTHETSHSSAASTKKSESMMNPDTFQLIISLFVFINHMRKQVTPVVCSVQT